MTTDIIAELSARFPPQAVITQHEDLLAYSYDGTPMLQQLPRAAVLVNSREEVAALLALASKHGTPVVTRGSGTGLSGGSVPLEGCIVLCTARMNRVLELDTDNLTIMVEPGVINNEVAMRADAVGLFYPPDPGSMKVSTIGGNVSENSGGLRGLKYGVTRDYVMGLEVVLATGETFFTGNKCVKDVAGYSLKDIFIGSEGTLGVVTKILLKLIPKPAARKTLLAIYERMDEAAATVSAIIAAKIIPCTMEFLDRTTIRCIENYSKVGLPLDCEAILLLESDGHPAAVEEEAKRMEQIAREHGARSISLAKDVEEATKLMTARRMAIPAMARVAPTTILEDATVPRSKLPDMVRFVQKTADKYKLTVGTFGHFGDGNLHPTFLANERNPEEIHRVHQAVTEIFSYAVELGGTISGEHGIGLTKKSFLPGAIGELNVRILGELKRAFDPKGILNPGKIFDQLRSPNDAAARSPAN
ncbi:MAG: FAD-binding protein [Verrucomicrobia bacterium]|nr:FAD-binding protein [Verrucomicrobiota bacterium]MBV9129626.1 FAD-binding protein [Verrucomicrobiota bacterium]MBV9643646.1 FAD-binding protein [Verrucomicrobiota bacterium]